MENLASLGIFFGGIGVFLISSGLFRNTPKKIKSNTSGISRYHTQIRPRPPIFLVAGVGFEGDKRR
jgi:hypothetical protein